MSEEVSGHLRWAFEDSEAFTRRQLDDLAVDLDRPGSTPTRAIRTESKPMD